MPCPSGHTVTGRFYKNSVLKKVKDFYNKKWPSKGWSGVHLLHDNASSHKCEVVKSFLASEKVKVLNHPPYSPDLSPCDFFLFPRLKKMLSVNKYTSRSSLGSAIYQWHQQIPIEDYLSAFRDWVNRLQKMCFGKGGILWRFVIKICLIKRSTEVIRTQWPNFFRTLVHLIDFPTFLTGWQLLGLIRVCFPAHQASSEEGYTLKKKEFVPLGAYSFLLEWTFSEWRQNLTKYLPWMCTYSLKFL